MRRGNGIPGDLCSASRESGTGKLPERSKSRQGLRPYPSNAYELTANTLWTPPTRRAPPRRWRKLEHKRVVGFPKNFLNVLNHRRSCSPGPDAASGRAAGDTFP